MFLDLGISRLFQIPIVLTLIGRASLEAARNYTSTRTAIFRFKRQRSFNPGL
jgi:hypothetical protein